MTDRCGTVFRLTVYAPWGPDETTHIEQTEYLACAFIESLPDGVDYSTDVRPVSERIEVRADIQQTLEQEGLKPAVIDYIIQQAFKL